MKVKPLFNLPPQNILAQSVPMARKKLVTKVKLWFSLSIQRTPVQSIATLPVPKEHKNQATKVRPLFNLRILFIPQLSAVSQRLKRKPGKTKWGCGRMRSRFRRGNGGGWKNKNTS